MRAAALRAAVALAPADEAAPPGKDSSPPVDEARPSRGDTPPIPLAPKERRPSPSPRSVASASASEARPLPSGRPRPSEPVDFHRITFGDNDGWHPTAMYFLMAKRTGQAETRCGRGELQTHLLL